MGEVVVGDAEGREEGSSLHYLGLYKNQALNKYYVVLFKGHCISVCSTETYWSSFISWKSFLIVSEDARIL